MPKGAKTKVITDQKPLAYDSTKVYMHMGTALKASETAQISLLRLAQALAETEEAKDLQEAALLERLLNIVQDIDEFERYLTKFEVGETQKVAKMVASALENARTSLGWFQKFLESHEDADAETYRPLADRLKLVVSQLVDVRKEKVANAIHMEDAFKERRSSVQKRSNLTRPVRRGPAGIAGGEAPTPVVMLSPEETLDNVRLEIIQKELGTKKS